MNNKRPLSHIVIKKMKPGDRLTDTNENRGLIVKKTSTGRTSFFYRYQEKGTKKDCMMKIGDLSNMTLSEARVEVQHLKEIRGKGLSPVNEKKKQKKQKQIDDQLKINQLTVKDVIDLYLTEYINDRITQNGKQIAGARKPKGQSEVKRTLYADVVKKLGDRKAIDITKKDIIELINEIVNRGAKVQAGNVLRELSSAYDYAIGVDKIDSNFINPILLAKRSLKQAKLKLNPNKGRRVFTKEELVKFLNWLPTSHLPQKAKDIFLLTLYTGCRTGEWCNAKWDDIDFDKKTLHIRLTKNRATHDVQLSSQACQLLMQIKENSKTEYVFSSNRTGKALAQKKLTEYTWCLRRDNQMLDIESWSPHDLRRTVRTGLSALQCPNEIAEAVLGHSPKGILGTYNLHHYDNECREWLQKWCDYLTSLEYYRCDISSFM